MTKAIAIIGAMFGDEGKGVMTDYFARQHPTDSIVIRFNGSCQAGHTVQWIDNGETKRHVFSHFGSGSAAGVPTYLAEEFVCNPLLYVKEKKQLAELDINPLLYVNSQSLVTTPYDMIVNMILEARRGGDRHGSCGIGFGETIARSLSHKKLTVLDLFSNNRADLRTILDNIRSEYIPDRFKDQPLDRNTNSDASWMSLLTSNTLIDDWLDCAEEFVNDILIADNSVLTFKTLIFEGAQGLMLDQQSPNFPHVTRSNTGIVNVSAILDQLKNPVESLDIVYVSRAYTTRHGAGPLDFEKELPYCIVDETNIPNINQGTLRFAPLLLDTLSSVTLHDFNKCDIKHAPEVHMAFTCLDQLPPKNNLFIAGGVEVESNREDFIGILTDSSSYVSYGPTADDVRKR